MAQRSNFGWHSALPATTDRATRAYLLAPGASRCAKNAPGVAFAQRDLPPSKPPRPVRCNGVGS
jgi:hypothetical protein